jgi:L-alanine-DL-glutamate epimerase-like enolase superfamily enzyme
MGKNLCVDANGRFDLKTAIEYGKAIEGYNLKWYEEAGDPLDYELNSKLSETYKNGLQQEKIYFQCKILET